MFFPQANETQDPSDMSDPSEVNQPHPVLFVQGPGRYIQVPYYVPVPTSHVYPNYPVDPNQTHWYPISPYGNAPIINGRQSESDGTEGESNVEDERGGTTSFPPPGVGLPAASSMQQHHLYQMMQPLSNLYVSSIPSGVSVQGYVNPPIPYTTSYTASLSTGNEPNAPQPNTNRVGSGGSVTAGRNSGKSNVGGGPSGTKIVADKQAGVNDSSVSYSTAATASVPSSLAVGQEANGCTGNDQSASTLPPTSIPMTAAAGPPPHHQPNFMPLGAMQYGYPYFSPTGPPHPPPHLTSAQHATGSPIYIPHAPAVPMYHHAPIYNSGPTTVFSADNGISPHSTVTVPVSVSVAHQPTDLPTQQQQQQHHHHQQHHLHAPPPPSSASNAPHQQQHSQQAPSNASHENESGIATSCGVNFNVKESTVTPNEVAYKNSTLLADSAPFEPENQKSHVAVTAAANYVHTDASSVNKDVISLDGSTLPDATGTNETAATVTSNLVYAASPSSIVGSDDRKSCSFIENEKRDSSNAADRINPNVENVTTLMNDLRVIGDSKEAISDEACDNVVLPDKDINDVRNVDNLTITSVDTDGKATDISTTGSGGAIPTVSSYSSSSSASSCCSNSVSASAQTVVANEHMNGKTNSSPDTTSSSGYDTSTIKSTASSETKSSDVIEEQTPLVQSSCKKSWASLFKETTPSAAAKSKATTSSSSSPLLQSTTIVRNASSEQSNSSVSSSTAPSVAQHYAVESVPNKSSSSYGNSSLNGVPSSHSSAHRSKPPAYKLSSPSLADDTVLPKIGESMKNYKLDHRAVNIEPRGLENKSNYCYINAILQALLACPPFYNLMKFISHNLHHHKTKLATKQHLPIIDSMVQFVEEFKLVPQKARRDKTRKLDTTPQEIIPGKPFEPVYMYNMLSVLQNNSSFVMGQQEDAQEFLTCLLNGLNDEMVELIQLADGIHSGSNNVRKSQLAAKTLPVNKNNSGGNSNKKISNGDIGLDIAAPDDSDSEWKQVQTKIKPHRPNLALTRTPLSDIFRGQIRSVLAKAGDQGSSTIEPFFTLHLNIEKVNSVKQALELLHVRDNVEGVLSSKTNQEVDAYQQQYLEELPYVLLLHLKYFDYKHHTCRKIKKSIEFPIDLKLDLSLISKQSPSHPKTAPSKSRQYKLFAVVYHDGNEATKGHYITDVFHIGYGGWVRYDDARVWTVSENEVLKPDLPRVPYLLYYRRCDTIAALMQPPFEKR